MNFACLAPKAWNVIDLRCCIIYIGLGLQAAVKSMDVELVESQDSLLIRTYLWCVCVLL